MDSEEGLRLRLMTLLSLYDLLPYSISNPPHGAAPLTLEQAIGPDALRRCLDAIARHHPQSLPGELSAILRGSSRNSTSSASHGQSKPNSHWHGNAGGDRIIYYSNHPTPSTQNPYSRGGSHYGKSG